MSETPDAEKANNLSLLLVKLSELKRELAAKTARIAELEKQLDDRTLRTAYDATLKLEKAERELADLRSKLTQLEHINKTSCDDWAEDHTHLQKLCRAAGCTEYEVEGDSYGVPGIIDLADLLAAKLTASESSAAAMREALQEADELLRRSGYEDSETWQPGQTWIFRDDKILAKLVVQKVRDTLVATDAGKTVQERLRVAEEALDNLSVAVSGAAFATPTQKALVQPHYDAARKALAALKGETSTVKDNDRHRNHPDYCGVARVD